MHYIDDVKGVVTQILPENKYVVKFYYFGSLQVSILKKQNVKVIGKTRREWRRDMIKIGSKLCFSCHKIESKEEHEYDWNITYAWLLSDDYANGSTVGVFLGLQKCVGNVEKLQNRMGILSCNDHTGKERSVLFLASNCFIRGKRLKSKENLASVLTVDSSVLFDAVPCIPQENDFNCEWFATCVWHIGPKPEYIIGNPSSQNMLSVYLKAVRSTKCLFIKGKGQVLRILNSDYGIALLSVQNNRWDTVLFHKSVTYLFKTTLANHILEGVLQEGDKVHIIAVPAPQNITTQWVASQVAVLTPENLWCP